MRSVLSVIIKAARNIRKTKEDELIRIHPTPPIVKKMKCQHLFCCELNGTYSEKYVYNMTLKL